MAIACKWVIPKKLEARPGRSSQRNRYRARACTGVDSASSNSRDLDRAHAETEPTSRGRAARPPLLVAPPGQVCQVIRREQRVLVLCAEHAGLLDDDTTLDLYGFGVLALL